MLISKSSILESLSNHSPKSFVDTLLEFANPSDGINGSGLFIICSKTKRILLGKRAGNDMFSGLWCTFGGGVEEGEHPLNTALREVGEEAGISPDSLITNHNPVYDDETKDGYKFRTYVATCKEEPDVVLNDEHTEHGWFKMLDLPKPLHPGVNRMLATPSAIRVVMDMMNR